MRYDDAYSKHVFALVVSQRHQERETRREWEQTEGKARAEFQAMMRVRVRQHSHVYVLCWMCEIAYGQG